MFSPIKGEAIPSAGKWMQLETIILSALSQSQKDEYHVSSRMRFLLLYSYIKSRMYITRKMWSCQGEWKIMGVGRAAKGEEDHGGEHPQHPISTSVKMSLCNTIPITMITKNNHLLRAWWRTPLTPATLRRQRQGELREFEVSLIYIVSSGSSRVTWWDPVPTMKVRGLFFAYIQGWALPMGVRGLLWGKKLPQRRLWQCRWGCG